jgi:hypothetical protein
MSLTASDVSSLTRSLSDWEYAEYGACAFVAIACAGEYIADFTDWLTAGDDWRKGQLAKRSTLLLIVSLAVELFCLVQTNSISGQLIGSLSDKATNAATKAQSALDKSGTAEARADGATAKADAVSKQYDDLLAKHTSAETEITELKAARLPRRLSSNQKAILRKRVARFAIKNIVVSCVNGGAEAFDFAQDFVDVFFHKPLAFGGQYPSSCSSIGGAVVLRIPPVQIEAGADRQDDATVLTKALAEIGIKKQDIVIRGNNSKALLALTIGPKEQ